LTGKARRKPWNLESLPKKEGRENENLNKGKVKVELNLKNS